MVSCTRLLQSQTPRNIPHAVLESGGLGTRHKTIWTQQNRQLSCSFLWFLSSLASFWRHSISCTLCGRLSCRMCTRAFGKNSIFCRQTWNRKIRKLPWPPFRVFGFIFWCLGWWASAFRMFWNLAILHGVSSIGHENRFYWWTAIWSTAYFLSSLQKIRLIDQEIAEF